MTWLAYQRQENLTSIIWGLKPAQWTAGLTSNGTWLGSKVSVWRMWSNIMHAAAVGLVLVGIAAAPARAQRWELPLVSRNGDTMYTDLTRIELVQPHIYRAWSKYVYANADSGTEALVQKEYDCKQRSRRVFSAVFYDANHAVTWESKKPGKWVPVTRSHGRKQWAAVCGKDDQGVLAAFISWLRSKL